MIFDPKEIAIVYALNLQQPHYRWDLNIRDLLLSLFPFEEVEAI